MPIEAIRVRSDNPAVIASILAPYLSAGGVVVDRSPIDTANATRFFSFLIQTDPVAPGDDPAPGLESIVAFQFPVTEEGEELLATTISRYVDSGSWQIHSRERMETDDTDRWWSVIMLRADVPAANPFAHLSDDFAEVGTDPDPTLRTHGGREAWSWYKETAVEVGAVVGGRMRIVPLEGGGTSETDPDQSWWYSEAGTRRSGMLLRKTVGPGAPTVTPRDFSVRARARVSNEAGDGPPPPGGGVFTFGGLAVHSPVRPPTPAATFLYDHAGLGTAPLNFRGLEGKTTQGDVSTFPVIDASDGGPSDPLEYDLRLDRIDQTVAIYFRPISSGEPLESNVGWALHTTVDHTTGAPGASAETLPDTVEIGLMVYSSIPGAGSPATMDAMIEVDAVVVLPIA